MSIDDLVQGIEDLVQGVSFWEVYVDDVLEIPSQVSLYI